jgi:hypothetical protein
VLKPAAAVVTTLALAVTSGIGFAATAAKPSLRVVRLSPFTVAGTGFKAAEKVTVTLTGANRAKATATANPRGAFTAAFPKLRETKCSYSLRAVGARGSRAVLAASAKPGCAPKVELKFGVEIVARGVNFKPRERVKVTVSGEDGTWSKTATADAKGTFAASFGDIALNECHAYALRAVGSLGTKFSFDHAAVPC